MFGTLRWLAFMGNRSLIVTNDGYVHCKSRFYTSRDLLSERRTYNFHIGENMLRGEIDSGVWAVSYLLSM